MLFRSRRDWVFRRRKSAACGRRETGRKGWTYIDANDLRRPIDAVFVESHLVEALVRLNPVIAEEPSRVDEIVPKLRAVALSAVNDGLLAANERMTTWLRGETTHKFVGTDDYVPVRLIDFATPSNNHLVVTGPGFGNLGVDTEVVYGTVATTVALMLCSGSTDCRWWLGRPRRPWTTRSLG